MCNTLGLKKLLADVKTLASGTQPEKDAVETSSEGEMAANVGDGADEIQVKAVQLVLAVDSTAFKDDKVCRIQLLLHVFLFRIYVQFLK